MALSTQNLPQPQPQGMGGRAGEGVGLAQRKRRGRVGTLTQHRASTHVESNVEGVAAKGNLISLLTLRDSINSPDSVCVRKAWRAAYWRHGRGRWGMYVSITHAGCVDGVCMCRFHALCGMDTYIPSAVDLTMSADRVYMAAKDRHSNGSKDRQGSTPHHTTERERGRERRRH
jgi:hypothetical protein